MSLNLIMLAAMAPLFGGASGIVVATRAVCVAPISSIPESKERALPNEIELAARILKGWSGDVLAISPSGGIPQNDSVVDQIRGSLGQRAGIVLMEVIKGSLSYQLKLAAGRVYARLGLPSVPLEVVLGTFNPADSPSVGTLLAAFDGLSRLEAPRLVVGPARAYYVCRIATLVATDSASDQIAAGLQNAILRLKVERNRGNTGAGDLLAAPEVQRSLPWLRSHGYEVGR